MLENHRSGYAVMSRNLEGISLEGDRIEELKKYCRPGYVIAERKPQIRGIKISIFYLRFYKFISIRRTSVKNILWLHWVFDWKYIHRTGKIVYENNG